MPYNWGGDVIYRDTMLADKRFVIGSPQQPVPTDIREWLHPTESRLLRDVVARVPGLPPRGAPGTFDRRAHALWDWVARAVRYEYDSSQRGYVDFWLFPEETLALGVGDCEDTSILLASLLILAGISPYVVRVVIGNLYEGQRLVGGHAWPVYQDEGGVWRLLESTLDRIPDHLPSADFMASGRSPRRYEPQYCFNGAHLWWIRPPDRPTAPPTGLTEHFQQRRRDGVVKASLTPALRQNLLADVSRR